MRKLREIQDLNDSELEDCLPQSIVCCVNYSWSRQVCTPQTLPGCSPDKEVSLVAGGLAAGVGLWPLSATFLRTFVLTAQNGGGLSNSSCTHQDCNLTLSSV